MQQSQKVVTREDLHRYCAHIRDNVFFGNELMMLAFAEWNYMASLFKEFPPKSKKVEEKFAYKDAEIFLSRPNISFVNEWQDFRVLLSLHKKEVVFPQLKTPEARAILSQNDGESYVEAVVPLPLQLKTAEARAILSQNDGESYVEAVWREIENHEDA